MTHTTAVLERLQAIPATPPPGAIPERWQMLREGRIRLSAGSHPAPDPDSTDPPCMCMQECAGWVMGEPWSDHPEAVSGVLHRPGQRINDRLGDGARQELLQLVPALIMTRGDGLDERRRQVGWEVLPGLLVPWLRLAGLDSEADAVLTAVGDAAAFRSACRAARGAAWRLRAAKRAELARRIEAKVRKKLMKRGVAAAAAAVAAAVADAVADAAAEAAAVAAAVADAAAEAAADAVADAVADAAADAAAVAADWSPWGDNWTRVYRAVRDRFRANPIQMPAEITELIEAQRGAAPALMARLINPAAEGGAA